MLSKHAQALGYDAVILFLDELVLWLASHAADIAFVNREGQKVAKLVEAMTADRPIPLSALLPGSVTANWWGSTCLVRAAWLCRCAALVGGVLTLLPWKIATCR